MNTEETSARLCSGTSATETYAEKLANRLVGGEVIELVGDVGAGKTTFVRGLAKGLGSTDHVSSPTFTVEQVYTGRLTLYHYDFYRLPDAGVVKNQLKEVLSQQNSVVVIEWAEHVRGILPKNRIVICFEVVSETDRLLHIGGGDK